MKGVKLSVLQFKQQLAAFGATNCSAKCGDFSVKSFGHTDASSVNEFTSRPSLSKGRQVVPEKRAHLHLDFDRMDLF